MMNFIGAMRWIAIALGLVFAGAANSADVQPTRLTVTGASTIAPLMADIAKAHEIKYPNIRTDVQTGGTSRGITDVRKQTAQIGMVSRALYDNEKDLRSVLIARDGIAMIVNKANSVQKLSRDQVIAIYSGKVRNWKEVGGPDMPITVVSKAEGRSTLDIFSNHFGLPYRAIKAHVIVGDNQQEIMTISGNKGSIGYVSIGSAEYEQEHGAPIKLVQLDNLMPSTKSVADGTYSIARDLNLVYREPLSPEARSLLDFSTSPAAKKLITANFFIPVP
ncbi:phosphate ABC transporter substrate-binding protein [Ramlibacter sp.]|uniref:phosphate ABC transporter substrate-binding protein n=1 Tax=Ramlibacter sp. TaxID=1917967 RepID=UPI0017E0857A|nr:phosphate ABC transporter substrate-binding protein [Ramlibacter sp.]MBA2672380.1 phosphate ABC transporter substrate-binding protein [Ramlibacter sp.]